MLACQDGRRLSVMKVKRLAALLLALMLVVGIFSIPTLAATKTCPKDGVVDTYILYNGVWSPGSPSRVVSGCRFSTSHHQHCNATRRNAVICSVCGRDIGSSFQSDSNYCPIGNAIA